MRLTFHGAAGGEVTGSCTLVESGKARLLVDFGQFQGGRRSEAMNQLPAGLRPPKLDAVLLTHGHLDHCGRLPLLARAGFSGVILATPATIEMAALILRDSAKIQVLDAERENRKRLRAGKKLVEPLFTHQDVEAVLQRFRPIALNQETEVAPGLRATYHEAGHMLGSASIHLAEDRASPSSVVFSGDLGPRGLPILRDAVCFRHTSALVLESTYGDRDHRPLAETLDELRGIVRQAVANRSRLLIPAFAVGRTQQIIYHLVEMFARREVDPFPVYVDSPMAAEASRIYLRHPELFDEEIRHLGSTLPARSELEAHVHVTESPDESRRLNDLPGPCAIIAGSGMCTAGRILHHFRHGLWNPSTHVIIVGYQGQGTLGRQLVEGAESVRIFGETIAVRAAIHTMGGFSAHAGQSELLDWFECAAADQPATFLNHGEEKARTALAQAIHDRHGIECWLPRLGESVEI